MLKILGFLVCLKVVCAGFIGAQIIGPQIKAEVGPPIKAQVNNQVKNQVKPDVKPQEKPKIKAQKTTPEIYIGKKTTNEDTFKNDTIKNKTDKLTNNNTPIQFSQPSLLDLKQAAGPDSLDCNKYTLQNPKTNNKNTHERLNFKAQKILEKCYFIKINQANPQNLSGFFNILNLQVLINLEQALFIIDNFKGYVLLLREAPTKNIPSTLEDALREGKTLTPELIEKLKIIGLCVANDTNKEEVSIAQVAVLEPFRRQGMAGFLLQTLLADLKIYNKIILRTAIDNKPAQDLYYRAGFTITDFLPNYYEGGNSAYRGTLDAYLMTLYNS